MAANHMLVKHNIQNFNFNDHSKLEGEWESDEEDFDPLFASKFCETILEEFQSGDNFDADLENLRNFIKIAPKPEDMKNLKVYLVNLQKKRQLLCQGKSGKSKKSYPCEKCGKVFGWPTDLKRHALIHSGLRPFSCEHCGASFNRNCLLRKHLSRLHPGQKPK